MSKLGTITRRTLLFGAAIVAGGAAFGYYRYRKPFANPLEGDLADGEATFNPYVKIASDNTITIIAPRAEMGQGVATTLAALVAEELDVRLDQVRVEHGPASPAYYNSAALEEGAPQPKFDDGFVAESMRGAMGVLAKFLALQFTGGSTSTVDAFEGMRHAGAIAREMLKQAASEKLGVPLTGLATAEGKVTDPASGRSLTYGELALAAAELDPPADVALRGRSEWKILGKPQMRTDMHAKVTGAPVFGIDVDLPDMLFATVRMNPHLGGRMKGFDAAAAKAMRGVVSVTTIDSPLGQGIAVIADNSWRAFRAADAVTVEWDRTDLPDTPEAIAAAHDQALSGSDFFTLRSVGDPERVYADAHADRIVAADYSVPYLAHATMEPMNATARLKDGFLDVWAPNQSPSVIQMIARRITGLDADRIRIHTTMMGGGFGRRIEPDFSDYAIRVAMLTEGRPVKVTWSREEDMTHGAYRPAAKARYKALLDADGMPLALTGSVASQSVVAGMAGRIAPAMPMAGPDKALIDGAYNQPYALEHYRIDGRKVDLPIPVGSWRSVGASFNTFMLESFIDEIAAAGGKDPLALRQALLSGSKAGRGVVDKVAEMSGWGTPLPAGKARGIAFALTFSTFVAEVVQVAEIDGAIRIEKVWCAVDPGLVLDPGIFKAQMMSGIVYGLSSAMNQEITFVDGVVSQTNFHDYDAMRIGQCPEIEVEVLENSDWMGGAGEPGTPPSIPALANAVFALTGKRIRDLPMNREVTFA